MTSDSFAFPAPGRAAWAPKSHRHHHHHHHHDETSEGERHGGGRHGGHRSEGRHGGPRGGRAAKAAFARELARQWAFARGKGGHGRPSPEELEELIALRRMRGGPFAGPGPFGPRGPRGRGRGGRARRGDVRLALLRLLAEEPANGYQLMQTIEERSGGRWRPSPGSVYPDARAARGRGPDPLDRVRRLPSASRSPTRDAPTSRPAPASPIRGQPTTRPARTPSPSSVRSSSAWARRRGRSPRSATAGQRARARRAARRDPARPVPDPRRGAGRRATPTPAMTTPPGQ